MKIPLRSLTALSAIAVLWSSAPAQAAVSAAHQAASSTAFASVGFLDFKTFLIGPRASHDPALASDRMRLVSPETLLYERARGIPDGLVDSPGASPPITLHDRPDTAIDSLTVKVNGAPVTLSLGLREAVLRDLHENIGLYGVPALFDPMPGVASAALMGRAAEDIIRRIDALEATAANGGFRYGPADTVANGLLDSGPSSLALFAFGLLAMRWLRRRA